MMTRQGLLKALLFFVTLVFIALIFGGENVANTIIFQHWQSGQPPSNHDVNPQKKEFYVTLGKDSVHVIFNSIPHPHGTIIYFHGNAGNLKRWNVIASELCKLQFNVLVWDYKGYGSSSGKTTLGNFITQGREFYKHVNTFDTTRNIILFGRSLGTGLASALAVDTNVDKIILETPFTSMKSLIAHKTWIGHYFVKNDIPSLTMIEKINKPILIIHGTDDQLIPYHMAENYFLSLKSEQKRMLSINGGTHDNLSDYSDYWNTLEHFLIHE